METGIFDWPLYGGTVRDWLVALGFAALIFFGVALLKPILVRRLAAGAAHTRTRLDDALARMLQATRMWLVIVFAASIGAQYLKLSDRASDVLQGATTVALFLQAGFWGAAALRFWFSGSRMNAEAASAGAKAATSVSAMVFLAQIVMWALVTLLALDNLGINVTALVAGLGVGGIAVALAVQNILGDLFASLSIVVDKPFVVGDFIIVENIMGTVEDIGLKTTRLRSLDGEQIVLSNSDLLKARVRNYKRMRERRVVFTFGVSYRATPEQLQKIPGIVKQILTQHEKVRFERSHFQKFGESALMFETVYWMTDPDYNLFMDVQQAANLALMRALAKEKVAFAHPVQVMQLQEPLRVETLAVRKPAAREESAEA